jgi:hypothetical protein
MPWTFAHPAAALPFLFALGKLFALANEQTGKQTNLLCRTPMQRMALVVGTISPDLPYYLGAFGAQLRGHSLTGICTVALPLGMLLLLFLRLLQQPLVFVLPAVLRGRIRQRNQNLDKARRWFAPIAILSWMFFGALTHSFWDAWTHRDGSFVRLFPALAAPLQPGLPTYQLLQHLSTIGGCMALAWALRRWLKCTPIRQPALDPYERWRYTTIALSTVFAVLAGALHALERAQAVATALYWRALCFQFAVRSVTVFAVVLTSVALLFWLMRGPKRKRPGFGSLS